MQNRQPMATIPPNIDKHDVSLLWSQFLDDFRHTDTDEKITLNFQNLLPETCLWV